MSKTPEKKNGWLTRCLNGIERVGNALPHPVTLFAIFALAVIVISALCAALGVVLAVWMHWPAVTPEVLLQGMASGLASTGLHQAVRQMLAAGADAASAAE